MSSLQGGFMIQVICYFLPPIISLKVIDQARKIDMNDKLNLAFLYAKWTLMLLGFTYVTLLLFSNRKAYTVFRSEMSVRFILQYLAVACLAARGLPLIESFYLENFRIRVNVSRRK